MDIKKNKCNVLLAKWMKWDKDLWENLSKLQIKILCERIVEEKSFTDLALLYKSTPQKVRLVFRAILIRIEKVINNSMADLLREINTEMEAKEQGIKPRSQNGFQFGQVHLN